MTRLHYVSPSLLPSRSANSVHVVHQCDGLVQAGAEITLYAKRALPDVGDLSVKIKQNYGVDASNWRLVTFHSEFSRADTLRIALMAVRPVLRTPRSEIVLSRNLYASWLLAAARRPMLFETHQLEYGIHKAMQRWIMSRPWVRTISISDCLVACLEEHHALRLRDPLVLHDAAPAGIARLPPESRRPVLAELLKIPDQDLARWKAICGYFGQLYAGRGVEIIEKMAAARPECLFLVFGGSESDVTHRRINAPSNLRYMGHVPHPVSQSSQASVDVLLMPYQRSVSIGVQGQDTARWMSPMKMFEYLAAGVPIISSDLPVLREVLENGKNALLVNPEDAAQWLAALDLLISNSDYANSIGELAHKQYKAKHTWLSRAGTLLAAGHDL
jgi:glycosyltransferase involved in cell wall biosynthesis